MKVYYNGFTYIVIIPDSSSARIFEMNPDSNHPVLPRILHRGNFHLQYIQDGFYSIVRKELPGENCINNMNVSYVPSNSGYVKVKFTLGRSKSRYAIQAKCIETDKVYSITYPVEEELHIPITEHGYRFSIIPSDLEDISMAGISYGFSPTLKYLNLPDVHNEIFTSEGCVEISLPYFDDGIFDLWCIDGDIMQINNKILNDKIIWHGKEFLLYERDHNIFNY